MEEQHELTTEQPVAPPAGWSAWLRDWTVVVPFVGAIAVAVTWNVKVEPPIALVIFVLLAASVLAAVHHAEIVAHRVGEPFGSLVLAVAVTVIEVALIVTLMLAGGPESASLARDTVFAAVMITCNGILGASVLIAALRDRVATFNAEGTATALATVGTLTTLSLVLPTVTTSAASQQFTGSQLTFAAIASLVLYGVFVLVQTVRHRDYFVPPGDDTDADDAPSDRHSLASLGLLLVALVAVVGLAKVESPAIEAVVLLIGAPASAVGVVIALLVLLPETLAAVRNARRGRVQASMNLSLGSAIASIGLTIPTIAVLSIWLPGPLVLGLGPSQLVLFAITMLVGSLTILPGRATVQEGAVHLVLLGAFLLLAIIP
jgi:Ca2+:H+ antiporter